MDVQLRTEEGELIYFDFVFDAFRYADVHPEVWKISWREDGKKHRVRLVRDKWSNWKFEPMIISKELREAWKGKNNEEANRNHEEARQEGSNRGAATDRDHSS